MGRMMKRSPSGARAAVASGLRVGRSETLAAHVLDRGISPVRALSAFNWIGAWGIFHDQLGREPRNVDEVAEALGISVRTAYGWQAKFREIFPEYSTPATLWELVHAQVGPEDDPLRVGLELGAATL